MNKSWKTQGVWSNILMSVWIIHTLIGMWWLQWVYGPIGINQTMVLGVTAIMSLFHLLYQFLWAASALDSEKTTDTMVSMLPGASLLASCFLVGLTPVEMSPDPIFWWTNFMVFTLTFTIDFWAGNLTGNTILTLKNVETRTDRGL